MLNEAKNVTRDFVDAQDDAATKVRSAAAEAVEKAGDAAAAAKAALSDLRRIADDFAARTEQSAEQAAETVKDV